MRYNGLRLDRFPLEVPGYIDDFSYRKEISVIDNKQRTGLLANKCSLKAT